MFTDQPPSLSIAHLRDLLAISVVPQGPAYQITDYAVRVYRARATKDGDTTWTPAWLVGVLPTQSAAQTRARAASLELDIPVVAAVRCGVRLAATPDKPILYAAQDRRMQKYKVAEIACHACGDRAAMLCPMTPELLHGHGAVQPFTTPTWVPTCQPCADTYPTWQHRWDGMPFAPLPDHPPLVRARADEPGVDDDPGHDPFTLEEP